MARANNGGWDFVKVGETYQYKEDWFIATVKVLEDNSTDEMYQFKLETIESNDDPPDDDGVFSIGHAKDVGGYFNGMIQLYESPEYSFTPKYRKPNP